MLVSGRQQRAPGEFKNSFALRDVAAGAIMELRAAHRMLELFVTRDLSEESVGGKQHAIVEENIVDPNYTGFAQSHVVGFRRTLEHLQAQSKMRIVIQV